MRAETSHVRIQTGDCATLRDLLVRSVESGADRILVEEGALPPLFYDLSTGAAGELVQGLVNLGIRMAVVLPNVGAHSGSFQAFAGEANRGSAFRFFPSEADAVAWLQNPNG